MCIYTNNPMKASMYAALSSNVPAALPQCARGSCGGCGRSFICVHGFKHHTRIRNKHLNKHIVSANAFSKECVDFKNLVKNEKLCSPAEAVNTGRNNCSDNIWPLVALLSVWKPQNSDPPYPALCCRYVNPGDLIKCMQSLTAPLMGLNYSAQSPALGSHKSFCVIKIRFQMESTV